MIWNFFKKDNKETESEDNSLETRINEALKKTEKDKNDEMREIKEMVSLAKDVIIDTYVDFFPNAQYSYYRDQIKETVLEQYESIKKEHSSKIDPEVALRSEKIVQGYLNQAALRETKIQFFDKLINEYNDALKKLKTAKERAAKIDKLNKHSEKLASMDESTDEMAQTYTANFEYEDIKKEFEFKEEYYKQMEAISLQYADSKTSYETSLAYKAEVEKINEQL